MNNLGKLIKFFLFMVLIGSLSSCGALIKGKVNTYATVERGAIPENFGKEGSFVLFVTHQRSYNKYLKRNVKKVYGGNHAFVTIEELGSAPYSDTMKYRYIFDYTYRDYTYWSANETLHGQGGGYGTGQVKRFKIYDRQDKKEYSLKLTSGFWSKLQRAYLKKLENQRKSNQNLLKKY